MTPQLGALIVPEDLSLVDSQHSHSSSQSLVTPVPGYMTPFSDLTTSGAQTSFQAKYLFTPK